MRPALLLLQLLSASPALAQPAAEPATLRGESPQTRKRLAEAEQKVLGGKGAEAVEDLQRILDEAGDDLISLDGRHHRSARAVAHQILAKLPADTLKTYQDRIDEPARKLLEAAKRNRDPKPLWQLLDRYFVSRPSEEGLLLLGDLLFERGEFRLAESIWKRLLPDADADVNYPNPMADGAAVRARIVLAIHYQGDAVRTSTELETFEKKHPDARGAIAGQSGRLAEVLRLSLSRPIRPVAVADRDWPTLGGNPARGGLLRGEIPIHWPMRPAWTSTILPEKRAPFREPPARPPFGHPVVLDGWVYVSDGHRVLAFELTTGLPRTVYPPIPVEPDRRSNDPPSSPSLTAAFGRLYARVGSVVVRPPELQKVSDSAIVCFDRVEKPGPNTPPMRELWRIKPPVVDGKANAVWEGAPLVANGRLWAAYSRVEGGRVQFSIACYDPADTEVAPSRPSWTVEVCESPLPSSPEQQIRGRMELLTLAGRNVVLNSNSGAVIALDAGTGQRAWSFQYPRTARSLADAHHSPDPAPAVVSDGRVFVAPVDAERAYALDSETGRELWESGPVEGSQILGVVRNRVILTTRGPVKSIRGLSVATGSYRRPEGWVQTAGLGYGRGILSNSVVLWPSREGLYFLDPETGGIITQPLETYQPEDRGTLFGNVAFADGWLVVVSTQKVWAYRPIGPPYLKPDDPRNLFARLIDSAEADLRKGDEAAARQRLLSGARGDFPRPQRAWAAARLLSVSKDAPEFPELRNEWLLSAEGELLTLGTMVDRRLGRPDPTRGSPGSPWSDADRKPLDAPSLGPDARVVSILRLPRAAMPLLPIRGAAPPRNLFVRTPEAVLGVGLESETSSTFTCAGLYTHGADLPDGFVAAGPSIVAVYGVQRDPIWVFRVPETDPLPGSYRVSLACPPEQLSSFVLAGDWLFARLGDRHLIALDLKARVVAWVIGTHGANHYEPLAFHSAPGFTPQYFASERQLAVQLTDGRRWSVQAGTGRVWNELGNTFNEPLPADFGYPTAAVPWKLPPAALDGNLIAVPDGARLVRFALGTSSKSKFSYQADGESSLAGNPPQIRRIGEMLFVAVRRNYGMEVDRLEPLDGKSEWRTPSFLATGDLDLSAADADPQRLLIPLADSVVALNLSDGQVSWQAKLPACARWHVRAGRKVAIVYPDEALSESPLIDSWRRTRDSFLRNPHPERLPWLVSALFDSWMDRTLPIVLLDLETGKLKKTIEVPAVGPAVVASLEGDLAAFATGDRIVWVK